MKLNEGNSQTEFVCMCCMEYRWRQKPRWGWICPYRAKDVYCPVVEHVYLREQYIHVMSQKGRAAGRHDLSLTAAEWLAIRRKLDTMRYPAPFQISYPLMWYEGDELSEHAHTCDAAAGNRLSVMSNCDCYFCTIAIGFADFTLPLGASPIENCPGLYEKRDNLCEVEKKIETDDGGYKYVCRFVKRTTKFL